MPAVPEARTHVPLPQVGISVCLGFHNDSWYSGLRSELPVLRHGECSTASDRMHCINLSSGPVTLTQPCHSHAMSAGTCPLTAGLVSMRLQCTRLPHCIFCVQLP